MSKEVDLNRRIRQIRAMPPGPKRDHAVKPLVGRINERIATYEHFFDWPRLIKSLEKGRHEVLSMKSPSNQVGQSK